MVSASWGRGGAELGGREETGREVAGGEVAGREVVDCEERRAVISARILPRGGGGGGWPIQ